MRHNTNDPVKRAEHITDQLQKQHERDLAIKGEYPYASCDASWLGIFDRVKRELHVEETVGDE